MNVNYFLFCIFRPPKDNFYDFDLEDEDKKKEEKKEKNKKKSCKLCSECNPNVYIQCFCYKLKLI